MERLTPDNLKTVCYDTWELCGLDHECKRDCWKPTPCKIPGMIRLLGQYEDTGLTPEEITAMQNGLNAYKRTGMEPCDMKLFKAISQENVDLIAKRDTLQVEIILLQKCIAEGTESTHCTNNSLDAIIEAVKALIAERDTLNSDKNRLSSECIMHKETIANQQTEIDTLKKALETIKLLTISSPRIKALTEIQHISLKALDRLFEKSAQDHEEKQ
jgi:hypothetical protein